MTSENLKQLHKLAFISTTALGAIVRAAMDHKNLKLHAAIEEGLTAAGYRIERIENTDGTRHKVSVFSPENEWVAFADSISPEDAIEHAMLGAMRENK